MLYLPLLFANGKPTSLENMTQEQLERFIPFMLSCCNKHKNNLSKPVWWPDSEGFLFPLSSLRKRPKKAALQDIVYKCYAFYKCDHVLRFCSRLSAIDPANLTYCEEEEGYVSIYNEKDELIVKFKKKNQTYDRCIPSPHKSLLPHKPQTPNPNLVIEDIYLCNYCDEEFNSVQDATEHEAVCCGKSEEVTSTESVDQVSALRYLGLCSSSGLQELSQVTRRGTSLRLSSRSYCSIPVSSPLGAKFAMNVSLLNDTDKMEYIQKIESNCVTKPCTDLNHSRRSRRVCGPQYFSISRRKCLTWSHSYCFNKKQREEKRLIWRTGLDKKSRNLFKKCKPVSVVLEKLPLLDPLALHAAARLTYLQEIENSVRRSKASSAVQTTRLQEEHNYSETTPVIDLCSSSEEEDNNDTDNNSASEKFSPLDKQLTNRNYLRNKCPENVLHPPFPGILKLVKKPKFDGPQYGVSARSTVPLMQSLLPTTAEEHAEVPTVSASQRWLTAASSTCLCENVCKCFPNSSPVSAPFRSIRI